jgi:branched-subunit amino acid aminotransferase/4-amino-4-deoxychorismate lyase
MKNINDHPQYKFLAAQHDHLKAVLLNYGHVFERGVLIRIQEHLNRVNEEADKLAIKLSREGWG